MGGHGRAAREKRRLQCSPKRRAAAPRVRVRAVGGRGGRRRWPFKLRGTHTHGTIGRAYPLLGHRLALPGRRLPSALGSGPVGGVGTRFRFRVEGQSVARVAALLGEARPPAPPWRGTACRRLGACSAGAEGGRPCCRGLPACRPARGVGRAKREWRGSPGREV